MPPGPGPPTLPEVKSLLPLLPGIKALPRAFPVSSAQVRGGHRLRGANARKSPVSARDTGLVGRRPCSLLPTVELGPEHRPGVAGERQVRGTSRHRRAVAGHLRRATTAPEARISRETRHREFMCKSPRHAGHRLRPSLRPDISKCNPHRLNSRPKGSLEGHRHRSDGDSHAWCGLRIDRCSGAHVGAYTCVRRVTRLKNLLPTSTTPTPTARWATATKCLCEAF